MDAAGRNVSAGSITLVAQKLTHLIDGTGIPLGYPLPFVTKSASYGGKVQTQGLKAGTYEAEFAADVDDAVHRVRFTLK